MAKKKKEWTFVRGANPSVVWDPAADKPLAEFADPVTKRINGIFTTTDENVAKRLLDLGYKEERDFPEGAPSEGFEPKKQLPDHSLPGYDGPSKKSDIISDESEVDDSKRKLIRRRK